MRRYKFKISLIIVLVSLFSVQIFSQQINYRDKTAVDTSRKIISKPLFHYSMGSSFMFIPRVGSVAGVTLSPVLSIPLSKDFSVEGGIIAGRYSAFGNINHESATSREFTGLSVFGSARYHVNSQLTLYGAGIKQVTSSSPFLLPKSSYVIGSSYRFENFSIGISVQMSKWNNNFSSLPFNDSQGFYYPYDLRPGTFIPFGR